MTRGPVGPSFGRQGGKMGLSLLEKRLEEAIDEGLVCHIMKLSRTHSLNTTLCTGSQRIGLSKGIETQRL